MQTHLAAAGAALIAHHYAQFDDARAKAGARFAESLKRLAATAVDALIITEGEVNAPEIPSAGEVQP